MKRTTNRILRDSPAFTSKRCKRCAYYNTRYNRIRIQEGVVFDFNDTNRVKDAEHNKILNVTNEW